MLLPRPGHLSQQAVVDPAAVSPPARWLRARQCVDHLKSRFAPSKLIEFVTIDHLLRSISRLCIRERIFHLACC